MMNFWLTYCIYNAFEQIILQFYLLYFPGIIQNIHREIMQYTSRDLLVLPIEAYIKLN